MKLLDFFHPLYHGNAERTSFPTAAAGNAIFGFSSKRLIVGFDRA